MPSQKRYVRYYEEMLRRQKAGEPLVGAFPHAPWQQQ